MSAVAALIVLGVNSAFATAQDPAAIERRPALNCSKVRLVAVNRGPVVHESVNLKLLQVDWGKGPHPGPRGVTVRWKSVKKLQTDASGEVRLSRLQEGTYQLELTANEWRSSGMFEVAKGWEPEACVQEFIVKGETKNATPQ